MKSILHDEYCWMKSAWLPGLDIYERIDGRLAAQVSDKCSLKKLSCDGALRGTLVYTEALSTEPGFPWQSD